MELVVEIIFLIVFLGFFWFFTVQAYNIAFRGYAPFLATRTGIIKRIMDELTLDDEAVIYELGSGRAGFLRAVRKKFPKAKLVGIEYSFVPYLIGQIQNVLAGAKIRIIKGNIFKIDLHEADLIYCYLNVDTMTRLEEVLKRECKPGAKVVSFQFPVPNKEAEKVIEIPERKGKVYIYKY